MKPFIAIVLSLFFAATQVAAQTAGIISVDTTWQAGSIISLTGNLQIAPSSTLTINEGVVVNANGFDIQVWGSLKASGSQISKITFNNAVFKFGSDHLTPGRIELVNARLLGGKFLPATGNESYGSFHISDSIFSSVSGFYIWYPTSESLIIGNKFLDSQGLSIGTRNNVTVRNNLFIASTPTVRGLQSAVESWATYDGATVNVSLNSFYVSSGYALALSIDGTINASENYFDTFDESKISALILDRADTLELRSLINSSFLNAPHPSTPVNVAPVVAITGGSRTVADTNGTQGEIVTLTATATDSDGSIASTQWLINGQVVATGTTANLSLADGATTVTFRATDNSGAVSSTTATITVTAPAPVNVPPVVAITGGSRTVADTNGTQGETVTLSATATDSDGSIASTEWLINGQVVATGTTANLSLADGATTVTFRATDNSGAVSSTTATITVEGVTAVVSDWLGSYNSIAPDAAYGLEINSVGLILADRMRLHSCVRIYENGNAMEIDGAHEIDITFNIISIDEGIIQLIASRPFAQTDQQSGSRADCSGIFEAATGVYRDFIKLGSQLFDAQFRLTDDTRLEFILIAGEEITPAK